MDFEQLFMIIPKSTHKWSADDVSKWLQFVNLPNLIPSFKAAGIDGSCIHQIDESILKDELDINSPIIRKKLGNWIREGFGGFDQYIKIQSKGLGNMCIDMGKKDWVFTNPELKKSQTTHIRIQSKSKLSTPISQFYAGTVSSESPQEYLVLQQFQGNSLGSHIIRNQTLSIGFGKGNQIHSLETSISERHALVGRKKNGKGYFVQDLGSKCGTYVKINHRTKLQNGMILQIGSYQFIVSQINQQDQIIKLLKIYTSQQDSENQQSKSQLQEQKRLKRKNKNMLNSVMLNSSPKEILTINLKQKSKFTFGRRKENDYQRDDKHMSGMHCKITFFGGSFYVQDYGSTNGTWIRISMQNQISPEVDIENESYIKLGTAITYVCRITVDKNKEQPKIKSKNSMIRSISMEKQNETAMLDENLCQACQKQQNNCLFFPCSHNTHCISCAKTMKACGVCGMNISEKVKIHKCGSQ